MMFRTHCVISLLCGLLVLPFVSVDSQLLFLGLVLVFGALPDIDTHKSFVGKKVPLLSGIFELLCGHRGIFHTIFIPLAILVGGVLYIPLSYTIAMIVGYIAHLLADAVTVQGIKPLHPLSSFQLRGGIQTGGIAEFVIFLALSVVTITVLVSSYWPFF